jgi:MFS family permease
LITFVAVVGGAGAVLGVLFAGQFVMLLVAATLVGGLSNPLYSLLIAYTNDFLEYEDMAAASAGLVFINGVGAIAGPLALGWIMQVFGPAGFWLFVAILLFAMAGFAGFRMTQRAAPSVEDISAYAPVAPVSSPMAVEVAQEFAIETAMEEEEGAESAT